MFTHELREHHMAQVPVTLGALAGSGIVRGPGRWLTEAPDGPDGRSGHGAEGRRGRRRVSARLLLGVHPPAHRESRSARSRKVTSARSSR